MTDLELTSLGWNLFFSLAFIGVLLAGIWFRNEDRPAPTCDDCGQPRPCLCDFEDEQ